jgi:hypothetical protein
MACRPRSRSRTGWQITLGKARGEFVWHQHEIDEAWRMSRIMAGVEYADLTT